MTTNWQPIETAPEGVELLVLRRDGVMHVAKVSGYRNRFGMLSCDFGNASASFFFPLNDNYEGDDAPTHWMPLPEAPK
ncbi:MAG TPA: DUF551 domain-containing protein [Spongiibacteraceae bacterium]|nr:DUF551 domain-containing protein [Spongiibacteraceae bacterium]